MTPTLRRATLASLPKQTDILDRMALTGRDTPHPDGKELWLDLMEGTGAKVDIECRLVGVPCLLKAPSFGSCCAAGVKMPSLFAALSTLKLVDNPAMHAAIAYKWKLYGRSVFRWRMSRFMLLSVSFVLALTFCPPDVMKAVASRRTRSTPSLPHPSPARPRARRQTPCGRAAPSLAGRSRRSSALVC